MAFAAESGIIALFALTHDLTEIYEGDVPSPAKEYPKPPITDRYELVVKCADLIEGYCFLYKYKLDKQGEDALSWYAKAIDFFVPLLPKELGKIFRNTVQDILLGDNTYG